MKLEKIFSFSLFIQFFTLFCATSVAPFPGLGRSPPWGHGRPTREILGTCSVRQGRLKRLWQAGRLELQAKLRNLWHVACLHALLRNSTIIWITLYQPPQKNHLKFLLRKIPLWMYRISRIDAWQSFQRETCLTIYNSAQPLIRHDYKPDIIHNIGHTTEGTKPLMTWINCYCL